MNFLTKTLWIYLFCGCFVSEIVAVKVIAHRGAWKQCAIPKNSIQSLKNSAKLGVYGSEFDVHYTKDNIGIIVHDDSLKNELIEKLRFDDIKQIRIGGNEYLPTLKSFLKTAKHLPEIVLFMEIKPTSSPERDREVAALVLKNITQWGRGVPIEFITFSQSVARELLRLSPDVHVHYLEGEFTPSQIKAKGFSGLDYHFSVYQIHPDWVTEAKELNLKTNVWTVNSPEIMKQMILLNVDYITTDEPQQLLELLSTQAQP
ncbi:MAG: glycerophosphodiester phosphodiesterase family protein [Bacteroidales bacterium]|nr:glycerophosphodiester phosphodiesterase family protein [Bacteroidales bacterium]